MEKFIRKDRHMRGVRMACKYSCVCEHARMYGFADALKTFATTGRGGENITQMLSHLDSKEFYDLIAKENEISDPFDIRIVSNYWRGIPKLKRETWHNFTVLLPIIKLHISHIQSEMVDDCLIHWAKVVEVNAQRVTVEYHPVVIKDGKLVLSEKHVKKDVENLMTYPPRVGDLVSVHFSTVIEKVEPTDANILLSITRCSLARFNKIRTRPRV